jgi:hypothetical protein
MRIEPPTSVPKEPAEPAEQALRRVLGELPARRAPASLEARVLGELARRAALPWWRRAFAHWPQTARAAFLGACVTLVACTILGSSWAWGQWHAASVAHSPLASWVRSFEVALSSSAVVAAMVTHSLPSQWAYGALAIGGALYALLFGLGAAAYHTLYRPSIQSGQPR